MPVDLETVIVIHGFAGKRIWMNPLTARLRKKFQVVNWSYNSFGKSIDAHADRFFKLLKSYTKQPKIHIVAHSMGSIVVRAALQRGTIENLGRIVMLAPPNRGTPVARFASPILGWICKPISELSTAEDSFVNSLPDSIGYPIGIVAGKFDLLVPPTFTKLPTMDEHFLTAATHNSFLLSKSTAKLAISFLESGSFTAST